MLTAKALRDETALIQPLAVSKPFWTVGDVVRRMRKRRGLTLAELAEKAGAHVSTIGRLERDSERSQQATILKAAKGLDVTIQEFYARIDDAEIGLRIRSLPKDQRDRILSSVGFQIDDLVAQGPTATRSPKPAAPPAARGKRAQGRKSQDSRRDAAK